MNINIEKLPKSEVKITIEINEEQQKQYMIKAAEEISKMVKVPGFRPGHVPLDVLKKHVREGAIEAHMIDMALPSTYAEAVKKENLQVITRPKITILQDVPLKYEATVGIYPEVKISGYDTIKVKKEEADVKETDVEEVLTDIQKRHAKYEEVDRESKKGDRIEIDFEGFDEAGAPLENAVSKNHPIVLGDGNMVGGFEDELIGLKKDDKKEFTVTFPKDYFHKPFQNKKVLFKVNVHKVDEISLPEFTPEFIKQIVGEEKTFEEVKANIKENIALDRKHAVKVKMEDEYLGKVAELVEVDIPAALLEEEIDGMMEEFKNELENRGVSLKQYLENTKKEIKDLRDQRKQEAEKRLKLRFALHKIFEQENLEATEEELKHEMEHMKELYPANEQQKVEDEFKTGGYLRSRLENKIKMDKLFARYLHE
jgi:trigger factor